MQAPIVGKTQFENKPKQHKNSFRLTTFRFNGTT